MGLRDLFGVSLKKGGFRLDAQTCLEILREVYRGNPFICYLDITIDAVKCGEATLSLVVDNAKHTNQYGFTHGGALESLADIALGVACATVGKRVMTLSFNMNFIKNIRAGERATAVAVVRHNGRRTMVVDVDTKTDDGILLTRATATMFIRDQYENIPECW